jgi:diadenylate cyclase
MRGGNLSAFSNAAEFASATKNGTQIASNSFVNIRDWFRRPVAGHASDKKLLLLWGIPGAMQFNDYIPTINSIRSVIDIALVFAIVYVILKLLRGTRAVPTVVGMVVLALLYWMAVAQDLFTLEFVLRSAVFVYPFLIIVLFQSEIRQALIYFGNRLRFPIIRRQRGLGENIYDEVVLAVTTLASDKIGALIVIERNVGLRNLIDAGVQLDAKLSYDLLVTMFHTSTPLHDGAVVIQRERIAAASVFLPLTKNSTVSRELGTRHRAAIGVTEGSDAVSVVVSEETGLITYVEGGVMKRNLDPGQLRLLLLNAMEIPTVERKRETTKTMAEENAI